MHFTRIHKQITKILEKRIFFLNFNGYQAFVTKQDNMALTKRKCAFGSYVDSEGPDKTAGIRVLAIS